jgi:glutamate/tyrosine decarboxylase-like PLP-dependent enzyme
LGKWYIHNIGEKGQKEFVDYCIQGRNKFVEAIKKEINDYIELYHYPKNINYISFAFKNLSPEQIEKCEKALMLRYCEINDIKIYKIPVMPHTIRGCKKFIQVIKNCLNNK